MYAKLTEQQINLLKIGRELEAAQRSRIRKEIFAAAKATFGIPAEHRLKVEIDNVSSPDYAVIFRKKDGSRYPISVMSAVGLTPTPTPVPPPPPEKRWFKIDIDGYVDGMVDELDWDDGVTDFPEMDIQLITSTTESGVRTTLRPSGVYIQLAADHWMFS